jgi:hypothetical protein
MSNRLVRRVLLGILGVGGAPDGTVAADHREQLHVLAGASTRGQTRCRALGVPPTPTTARPHLVQILPPSTYSVPQTQVRW